MLRVVPLGLRELIGDRLKDAGDGRAQRSNGRDRDERNQRGQERVLEKILAFAAAHEFTTSVQQLAAQTRSFRRSSYLQTRTHGLLSHGDRTKRCETPAVATITTLPTFSNSGTAALDHCASEKRLKHRHEAILIQCTGHSGLAEIRLMATTKILGTANIRDSSSHVQDN
jgi:hypothetical protein